MPSFEATVSETTEPMNASVIATFSEAKKYGSERGRPIFSITSARLAPSARSTSSSSGSMVASPVATLTVIGKKQMTNAVRIAGTVPMPNHTTTTGTSAAFGMLLKPTISGLSEVYARRDEPTSTPSSTPTTTPMANPAMVVHRLCSAWPEIGPAYCLSETRMAEGAGKMKSETPKPRQISSHSTTMIVSRIHGAQVSSLRLRFATSARADAADVLAQLAHDLGEVVAVGDFQVARPRQVDRALREDPAGA